MTGHGHPWSFSVRLDEVPESGWHVELEASSEVRAALAKPAGVDAVERLTASFDLTRRGREGLHVAGQVGATVRQSCVVSLEPLVNEIAEDIDVDYAPPGEMKDTPKAVDLDEGEAAASSPDEPEPLTGNGVDLGLLATEFFILGVDPYPRKPGVAFAPPETGEASHPFAALEALKNKGPVKE